MYRPTATGYFSGIGGLEIGAEQAGVQMVQSLEYDQEAVNTLKANFSHNVICKDIRNQLVSKSEDSDIIFGTYPCTKYSSIADIHGTRTGDEMYLEFFRFLAIKQPEMYVLENVPGMKKFPVVMEAMTKLPGYYVSVFCPVDAKNWLPQKRKRLIIFGTKKPFHISEPAPSVRKPRLMDIIDRNVDMNIPDYVHNRLNGKYRDLPIISDPSNPHELAPTCVAHYSKDLGTRMVKDTTHPLGVRPYTPREWARLQGFPDTFKFTGSATDIYKQVGNAVPVPLGRWVGEQCMKYFN